MSIGDVLTLLRQEFPDVTISKIRFLESQGLVNPERTPSGYRKFYEHDVERLRWVLRQQREHFLPLKVIKDRLDDEGDEAAPATAEATPVASEPVPIDVPVPVDEPVLVGQRSTAETGEARASAGSRVPKDDGPSAHSGGPTLPGIETRGPTTNGGPPVEGSLTATHRATPERPPARRSPTAEAGPAKPARAADRSATPSSGDTPAASGRARSRPAASTPAPTPAGTEPVAPARPVPTVAATGEPAPRATKRASARADAPTAGSPEMTVPAGASLSLEELSAASGLDPAVLDELVDFGLLAGTTVAGQVYFDGDALAVATVAAGFARFGVEPRHLRLYKNAADREAGFVEQIVLPLVRQRNPEARVRAHETVDELAQLGQQLRASLLRSALGTLLDG